MKHLVLFCSWILGGLVYYSKGSVMEIPAQIVPVTNLGCDLFEYEHSVLQVDSQGRKCWGNVMVLSCRGRCDSKEISDWKFPHKKAFHPVCLHNEKVSKSKRLTHCENEVDPGTETYDYVEAKSCKCQVCSPEKANCIGQVPVSKPSHPNFPFLMNGKRFETQPYSLSYVW